MCDELFLGSHVLAGSEMTTQVVPRSAIRWNGSATSFRSMAKCRSSNTATCLLNSLGRPISDGKLKLWAGNLAVHAFDVEFLARAASQKGALPFHMAKKKVACLDTRGNPVEPEQPNAIRFERFIFDLLPLARQALVVEADPAEAFAPVKNSDEEATDNPRTAKSAMMALHRRWLRAAGADIADDVPVEINPLWASTIEEIRHRLAADKSIRQPTYFSPTGPQTITDL